MDLMDVGAWCVTGNWIKLVLFDLFGLVGEGYIILHALHAWEFAPI